MSERIAIFGGGAFGTACAVLLAGQAGQQVHLWVRRADEAAEVAALRENRRLLPGVSLPDLVTVTADPAWADALAHAPFCLAHLVRLLAAPDRPASFEAIEAAQLARLDGLQERIDGLAHHSAQDRRHLLTDEERVSADQAAAALGGS